MSTKHTPGPWPIERTKNGSIKAIGPCVAEEYAGSAWLEVPEEDASLISVAPTLLRVVKIAIATYEGKPDSACPSWVVTARAAIAKATGEQQ